jgi:tyrosinase
MAWSTSPNDPVFFLHHSNVDRLWAQWQQQQPEEGYVPNGLAPRGHNVNDPMDPWRESMVTPASVLDHKSLDYMYDKELEPMKPMTMAVQKMAAKRKALSPFVWEGLE